MQYVHEVFGQFYFRRMTVKPGFYLQAVDRHELNQQVALIAQPMRALMDLVYLRKLAWQGMGFLTEGMRIDEALLRAVPSLDMIKLLDVYKGQREQQFMEELLRELGL